MEPLIRVQNLMKIYNPGENEVRALDDVSLDIGQGEFVAIIGQSGSGKSTFMNMLGCLDVPTSGHYYLNGKDVSSLSDDELSEIRNQEIGFIFQGFNLIQNLTALENVELPLIYRNVPAAERKRLSEESLKRVGLEKRMDHKPTEMSGGQQQRVAIARALAAAPPLILADEPTGNLDSKSSREIMDILRKLHTEGRTVMIRSHSPQSGSSGSWMARSNRTVAWQIKRAWRKKMEKNNKKKKKWKMILPVAVVVILVIVFVQKGKGSSEPVQEVETAKAEKGNITAELETSGTIGSEDMRTYSSPVNAEIATADLQVGKPVKKGESLITFNTASLEKSYNISQLQNKASDAANQKSLEMSAKGSEQAAQADARIQSIDDQLNGLNGQISELAAQTEQSKNAAAEAGNLDKEITELDKRSEELKNKKDLTKEEQKELEKIQKEKNKKQEQRKAYGDVTAKVSELENQLKNLQSQAESLQGSKAEEQSKKAAGEASVLTDAEKQGITSSQQAAKLTLSQSADSLAEAKAGIQAEFDGIVTSTEVAAGSAVQEGAPMFSIADASKMCVDFKVSKYNLTNLEAGQKVTITSLDRKYQGSVTNIGKVAEKNEQGVAMATARVHIDDPDDHLIIGLDAKLKIELGKKTDVLKVPIAAVNSDSKGDFVYVFSKDKLQKKYVKTGISSKKNVEIIKGLKEGETVVTTIDTTIEDGMKAAEKK